tara:strand:+ start:3813 stop:4304 length:492 start_codon:yes stop_codon:yes gene_type:complete
MKLETNLTEWLKADETRLKRLCKFVDRMPSTIQNWRYRVPHKHVEKVAEFTGLSVEGLLYGGIKRVKTGINGPDLGARYDIPANDLELWRARTAHLPASLDNELMGTPPPGRSVWDQTKAIRGPDGRLLDEIQPLNVVFAGLFDRIRNISKNESRSEHAPLHG